MKRYQYLSFLTLILFSTILTGCGIKTVSVSGKILVDGQPAENIRVVFQADSTTQQVAPVAIGLTDANGAYTLELAKEKKKGAAPGDYVVFLSWKDPEAELNPVEGVTEERACPYNLPPRANNGELRFTVPDKGTNEANFEFDSNEAVPKGYIGV